MSKATENLKEIQEDNLILAEGEVTGHAHRICCKGGRYNPITNELTLPEDAEITHEEHNIVGLPAGEHFVGIKQEYDPFESAVRQVKD